jgi:hypothetical protein
MYVVKIGNKYLRCGDRVSLTEDINFARAIDSIAEAKTIKESLDDVGYDCTIIRVER